MTTTDLHPDDAPVYEGAIRTPRMTARAFLDVLSDGTAFHGLVLETARRDGPMLTLDLSDWPEGWDELARICGEVRAALAAQTTQEQAA